MSDTEPWGAETAEPWCPEPPPEPEPAMLQHVEVVTSVKP